MNVPARAAGAFKNPHIKTTLPGPKSRAMIERDTKVTSPSYPRDYPFVISHGKGTEVWDVDGNRFLDFAAGIAVCATGHAHPRVVKAVQEAAGKFLHISSDYWHEEMTSLAEKLSALAPMSEPAMVFLCQSGTESVEGALKLARYVTRRGRVLGFLGGFHGRTMGSLSLTSSKYTQQAGFFPSMPGVTHVPYPNGYRPLFAGSDQGKAVLDYIRMLFERNVPAQEVAAIVVEPFSVSVTFASISSSLTRCGLVSGWMARFADMEYSRLSPSKPVRCGPSMMTAFFVTLRRAEERSISTGKEKCALRKKPVTATTLAIGRTTRNSRTTRL